MSVAKRKWQEIVSECDFSVGDEVSVRFSRKHGDLCAQFSSASLDGVIFNVCGKDQCEVFIHHLNDIYMFDTRNDLILITDLKDQIYNPCIGDALQVKLLKDSAPKDNKIWWDATVTGVYPDEERLELDFPDDATIDLTDVVDWEFRM